MMGPLWDNPPADMLVLSATMDDLSVEHVRDRMEQALVACTGLNAVDANGCDVEPGERLTFGKDGGVEATVKPFTDMLGLSVTTPSFKLNVKMPPDRSSADMTSPDVPAWILKAAVASMKAQLVRPVSSHSAETETERLLEGMTSSHREATMHALVTSCAIIAAQNPGRRPDSIVRILLAHQTREARIVDQWGNALFRKKVERKIVEAVPSAICLESSTHGYVDFKPAQVGIRQGNANLDPMSIMRLASSSGVDPTDALLSAGMS